MLIFIDELVNLYKIPNAITRQYNYEKLLTMYNDTLQGKARYLGIRHGRHAPVPSRTRAGASTATRPCAPGWRRGSFSRPGARDLLAPVIRLEPLTPEEMLRPLTKSSAPCTRGSTATSAPSPPRSWRTLSSWSTAASARTQNITPREVIRDFIELLDLLYQNPSLTLGELMESEAFTYAKSAGRLR